jgi:spore maturation protein CgeB
MIKVLAIPLCWHDVRQDGWLNAFQQSGCEVQSFDFIKVYEDNRKERQIVNDLLYKQAIEFKPDLLFVQIQHTDIVTTDTIKKIKQQLPNCKAIQWSGDVRNYVPITYAKMAQVCDYNFISNTGQIDFFKKELNKDMQFMQIGVNPILYYPEQSPRSKFDYDLIFIANRNNTEGYPGHSQRDQAVRLLRKELGDRFCLYGSGWPSELRSKGYIDQKQIIHEYHKSFVTLSISHYNELNHYFSDRLLMCMASGRPTISLRFPGWESYFTNNCDFVIANSIEEIPVLTKKLIKDPALANFIGKSGAEKIKAEHTYLSRTNELLQKVGLK